MWSSQFVTTDRDHSRCRDILTMWCLPCMMIAARIIVPLSHVRAGPCVGDLVLLASPPRFDLFLIIARLLYPISISFKFTLLFATRGSSRWSDNVVEMSAVRLPPYQQPPPGRPQGHTHGPGAMEACVDQEALPDTRLDMIVLALAHV